MKNKDFMIFQTAVRKYVRVFKKGEVAIFVFCHRFKYKNWKNFGQKIRKIFIFL
jgi:hypothetical protein